MPVYLKANTNPDKPKIVSCRIPIVFQLEFRRRPSSTLGVGIGHFSRRESAVAAEKAVFFGYQAQFKVQKIIFRICKVGGGGGGGLVVS